MIAPDRRTVAVHEAVHAVARFSTGPPGDALPDLLLRSERNPVVQALNRLTPPVVSRVVV